MDDQSLLIQLLQQQSALLQQLLEKSTHPAKATPAKRTTLRQQVHNDFKQTFYTKWKLSTNPPASQRTSAKR